MSLQESGSMVEAKNRYKEQPGCGRPLSEVVIFLKHLLLRQFRLSQFHVSDCSITGQLGFFTSFFKQLAPGPTPSDFAPILVVGKTDSP